MPNGVHNDPLTPTVLVWSASFHSGWHVLLDGSEVSIFAVDHALMGVKVPRGTHQIDFAYTVPSAWN